MFNADKLKKYKVIMIKNELREKIVRSAILLRKYGIDDLAWSKKDAIYLINSILNENIGILGGDVYILESNRLTPTYDNWYVELVDGENKLDLNLRSKNESLSYIESYLIQNTKNTVFSITFDETIDPFLTDSKAIPCGD